MKYLKPYTLFESVPSAERLVSLGLYDGPVIRWELTANPSSWIESSNPVIGRFLVDEVEGGESIGMGNYWTLYLSSFKESYSDLVEWHLNRLFKLGPSSNWKRSPHWLDLKATVQDQLGWAVLKYKPETWSDGDPVAAQCLNTGEWTWCKKPIKPLL